MTFVTFDGDENNDNSEPVEQYTVVNISDVSAYQNEHTVIAAEDNSAGTNRILSTTQNEDGTLTYMVATDGDSDNTASNYEGKTVFFKLVMPEENDTENS